jgi:FixJ family two-component response regulator
MKKNNSTINLVACDAELCDEVAVLADSVGLNVSAYKSADEFFEKYDHSVSSCLVVDVRIPGMGGLTFFEMLRERKICVPTIFVTSHGTVPLAVRVMKMGAFDFFERPFDGNLFLERIQQAICLDRQQQAWWKKKQEYALRMELLSRRERQVLEGVLSGKTNKAIGLEYKISHKTVEFHRMNIMKKMGTETLVDLARMMVLVSNTELLQQYG